MNFTDKQSLLLSQLAYLNLHSDTYKALTKYGGNSLKNIASELLNLYKTYGNVVEIKTNNNDKDNIIYNGIPALNKEGNTNGCIAVDQYVEILNEIKNDKILGGLVLTDYVNNNDKTGFVAYAFKNPESNDSIFAFRGSDDGGFTKSIDWPDNFAIGISGKSIQEEEVQSFGSKKYF